MAPYRTAARAKVHGTGSKVMLICCPFLIKCAPFPAACRRRRGAARRGDGVREVLRRGVGEASVADRPHDVGMAGGVARIVIRAGNISGHHRKAVLVEVADRGVAVRRVGNLDAQGAGVHVLDEGDQGDAGAVQL